MKVKNVNPLEQHVEKIVVAVAAAAALYLGYSAYSDATSVDGPGGPVTAGNVEKTVSRAVDNLQNKLAENQKKPISIVVTDYLTEFNQQQLQPLNSGLLAGVPAGTVPKGASLDGGGGPTIDLANKIPVVAPVVMAPINVQAKARRAMVIDVAPPAAGGSPVTPAVDAPRHDQQWVEIIATFPMLEQLGQITGATIADKKDTLPPGAQRLTIYRLDVERQERQAGGGWSEWTPVTEPKNQNLPTVDLSRFDDETKMAKVKEALDQLDQRAGDILQPPLPFQVTEGTVATPGSDDAAPNPTAEQAKQRERLRQEVQNRQKAATPTGGPVMLPPNLPGRGPMNLPGRGPMPLPGRGGAFTPPAGIMGPGAVPPRVPVGTPIPAVMQLPTTPAGDPGQMMQPQMPGQPLTAESMRSQDEVKVWFWDTTVKPGVEYRYRARVRIYNPIYQWPTGYPVKDEAQRNLQWIASPWAVAAATVQTQANQHYFLTQSMDKGGRATVRIYQYVDGRWIKEEVTLAPGQPVQTSHRIEGTTRTVAMDTGCVLVDVASGQNETRAVLLDTAGQLIVRDTRTDGADPRKAELEELLKASAKPIPAATPGATPIPVAPQPGGGRPTGIPAGAPIRVLPIPPAPK